MVAVFMPGLKLTLGAASPDHQSHADLPALIHDVSAIFDGGFRFRIMFDSISRPGSSPIISTRHGVVTGASACTAIAGLVEARRQLRAQRKRRIALAQIHARIVVDIGLGHRHPARCRAHSPSSGSATSQSR